MIYVSSDWHGCPLSDLGRLLKSAGFGAKDYLFVLGDVIDRGEHGASLIDWLMKQPNVQFIMGNHERMLLDCAWLFDEITDFSLSALSPEKLSAMSNWLLNGARPTLYELRRAENLPDILEFLSDAPLYEAVTVGGRDFVLTHAGLGNFAPDKRLSQYTPEELLWNRPLLTDVYFPDITTVFGHTPVSVFGEEYSGRALRRETWVDIDTGAGHGGVPCLLRLDDMREFYI